MDELSRAAADISARHPGVGVVLGAETVYHFLDYQALAERVSLPNSRTLLTAMARLWPRPAGRPRYFEPISDVAGCVRPDTLARDLADLAQQQAQAPGCLQEHLRQKVSDAVEELASSTCFCDTKNSARSAMKQVVTRAEQLGVKRAAPPFQSATRFNCQ
ncbi:MAG: hypothetical protein QM788_16590 [Roseateles sp.]|uniref:hypothetical protein n=1 Tax=Roseateles sp. TaxID=1971397 RepID=UPI0039E94059